MRKRFVARRKRPNYLKYILYIIIIYIICYMLSSLITNKIKLNNEFLIKGLLIGSKYNMIIETKDYNFLDYINVFKYIPINEPTYLIKTAFSNVVDISNINDDLITDIYFNDDYQDFDYLQGITEYIPDPNPNNVKEPKVFLYNSHQLETYQMNNHEIHNIRPNVMMASYILREKLNKLGVATIVDETNLTELIRVNGWSYTESYKASRMPLKSAMEEHKTLEYFIDIHRDSPKRKDTTIKINDKEYAKILFVIGLDHNNYGPNLELARTLHQKIEQKYPGLSRGVLTKNGKGVNGIYNQDLSPKAILLEIGGFENNIEEVLNTTEIFAEIFYSHIKGD
ncbi:MAG: stage II sporulation protein P [Bacilli bacterium]|nr:stage II sporulation protein P [Bacilli bacterium]